MSAFPACEDWCLVASAQNGSEYHKSCQWSPDGTTILTSCADNALKSFILPPDLLTTPGTHHLTPYSNHQLPGPAYATAIHPAYSLGAPCTALFIVSPSSLPIRLLSPFSPNIVASYPLINSTTEVFIAPHSLLFDSYASHGNQFFAGSESQVSIFDVGRSGEGPVAVMKTIPSRRKKLIGGGVGMKGIISALSMSNEGILAGGTFSRWIGLYDGGGRGGTVGVFQLGKDESNAKGVGGGAGVTQLAWSTCGRYLCVAERGSDGIGLWDIRGTGRMLSWMRGRRAKTMQRLGVNLANDKVYAGGTDGVVRVWQNVGKAEGVLEPDLQRRLHEDAVSSVLVHPLANILATCSGQRHDRESSYQGHLKEGHLEEDLEEDLNSDDSADSIDLSVAGRETIDNSLRVWAM